MTCDLGDFGEYWALRERAKRMREEAARERARRPGRPWEAVAALRPGDVIIFPAAGGAAWRWCSRTARDGRRSSPRTGGTSGVGAGDFDGPPSAGGPHRRFPGTGAPAAPGTGRDLAARLATLPRPMPPDVAERRSAEADPKARPGPRSSSGRAARPSLPHLPGPSQARAMGARASKLERELAALDRRIRSRTETLGRQFDRVVAVLEELGYVEDFGLTPKGERPAQDLRGGRHPGGRGARRRPARRARAGGDGRARVDPRLRVARAGPDAGRDPRPRPLRDRLRELPIWAHDPPGRGQPPGGAVPRARPRVHGHGLRLGRRARPSRRSSRSRASARRLRAQLQAGAGPPSPDRGRGRPGDGRLGPRRAGRSEPQRGGLHRARGALAAAAEEGREAPDRDAAPGPRTVEPGSRALRSAAGDRS